MPSFWKRDWNSSLLVQVSQHTPSDKQDTDNPAFWTLSSVREILI